MEIKIRRVLSGDEHLDQKWVVLEGYVEGTPVAKRVSINTAALVDGSLSIVSEKEKLRATVVEYLGRWLVEKELIDNL